MYIIDEKFIISEELFSEQFMCNLNACKGACCWEGDMGAPLEEDEVQILEQIYSVVKPYLTPAGIEVIEKEGFATHDPDNGEYATPLIDGGPCVYITYSENGTAFCGIEQAYRKGEIDFQKPISCHLYPVRLRKLPDYIALNYDEWDICSAACQLGKEQQMPVFRFVKDALIRRFGAEFYAQMEGLDSFNKENNR